MGIPRHAFVIPAYGESPYLADCIASLLAQRSGSDVLISTSTPNAVVDRVARNFGIRVHVHDQGGSIARDWNAALAASDSPRITLAHQDDRYLPSYAEAILDALDRSDGAAMAFCDYQEIGPDGTPLARTRYARIKDALVRFAKHVDPAFKGNASRMLLLGLGNPIACAAVTLDRKIAPGFRFEHGWDTNLDWLAWLELVHAHGAQHVPSRLLQRRVHPGSETNECIRSGARMDEDRRIFLSLWPVPFASMLARLYRLSYGAHQ